MAKVPYRAIVGLLSFIMGHTKPDIVYALNVLSRYCNNPGRRHVESLLYLVKYCECSKDDRLKFHGHPRPYDADTIRPLTQARFQFDADLAGNLDNSHSTSAHIGYIGMRHLDLAELLIKEKVDAKDIKLLKVASADNTSD